MQVLFVSIRGNAGMLVCGESSSSVVPVDLDVIGQY